MEVTTTHLDQLIQRLQKEGVEAAQTQAAAIVNQAEIQAKELVAKAIAEADLLRSRSEVETESRQTALDKRLRIAARDLVLVVQERLNQAFHQFLQTCIQGQLDQELLKACILSLAKTHQAPGTWTLVLPPEQLKQLEAGLISSFAQELQSNLVVQSKEGLSTGFYLQQEGQRMYFDFTATRLTEIFYKQLSGNLKEVLGNLAQEETSP